MDFDASHRLATFIREGKEARLKDFLTEAIRIDAADAQKENRKLELTVIARSPDSPVARAVGAVGDQLAVAGYTVRVLLVEIDVSGAPVTHSIIDLPAANFRLLSDQRFGDVHEQMIIGHASVWIGDCMRRDPNKRDALELMRPSSSREFSYSVISFDRLWTRAKPVGRVVTSAVAAARAVAIAALSSEKNQTPRSSRG